MFRLLRRVNPDPIFSSKLYDEKSFYGSFIKDLRNAEKSIVIESPYLTTRRSLELSKILLRLHRRGVQVKIYTREPRHHSPYLCQQSVYSIGMLRDAGAIVYICRDYRHRKLAVIDGLILYEGSLNILSQNRSRELMRRTVSSDLSKQVLSYTGLSTWGF